MGRWACGVPWKFNAETWICASKCNLSLGSCGSVEVVGTEREKCLGTNSVSGIAAVGIPD